MLSIKQNWIKYHFWVFGMIRPGTELRSPRPLANTLLIRPMTLYNIIKHQVRKVAWNYNCFSRIIIIYLKQYNYMDIIVRPHDGRCIHRWGVRLPPKNEYPGYDTILNVNVMLQFSRSGGIMLPFSLLLLIRPSWSGLVGSRKLNYLDQKIQQTPTYDIRKHWTAVSTLLGLISSGYRDFHHRRSNQRPQITEPKLVNWATIHVQFKKRKM